MQLLFLILIKYLEEINNMKNKMLAILGAAVISVGAIGGVAVASNTNDNSFKETQQIIVEENSIKTSQVAVQASEVEIKDNVNDNKNYNKNSANNPSGGMNQDMVKIMRDNGFKDAARYMQTGNYDAMKDYMETLSQVDFNKMVEIMNSNGYSKMGQMMESLGREGMIQMHNAMGSNERSSNNSFNMMGGF